MLTMEEEILPISSDMPLVQDKKNGRHSRRVGTRWSRLSFFPRNRIRGRRPPIHWLIPVARAAPATHQRKTTINKASRLILVSPAMIVTIRPA